MPIGTLRTYSRVQHLESHVVDGNNENRACGAYHIRRGIKYLSAEVSSVRNQDKLCCQRKRVVRPRVHTTFDCMSKVDNSETLPPTVQFVACFECRSPSAISHQLTAGYEGIREDNPYIASVIHSSIPC